MTTTRLRPCSECNRPTTQPDLCQDCIDLLAQEIAFYHEHGQPHPSDPKGI